MYILKSRRNQLLYPTGCCAFSNQEIIFLHAKQWLTILLRIANHAAILQSELAHFDTIEKDLDDKKNS
jgi:hypothetical protein